MVEGWLQKCEKVVISGFLFHNVFHLNFNCRVIGHVVVEISLVCFSYTKANYVSEIRYCGRREERHPKRQSVSPRAGRALASRTKLTLPAQRSETSRVFGHQGLIC